MARSSHASVGRSGEYTGVIPEPEEDHLAA